MIRGVPYDAEVEFLESTRTQWIDTGIQPPSSSHVRCSLFLGFAAESSGRRFYFSDGNAFVTHYAEVNSQNRWGTNNSNALPVISSGTMYYGYAEFTNTAATLGITINGDEFVTETTSYASGSWGGLLLFRLDNRYRGIGSRIGECEITVNGVLVRDFIPVRFTNEQGVSEGAMFDRVTRKLFRNAGTGAFVIGPDVATPVMGLHFMRDMMRSMTAKDYIQDGLVAMWDGIENAGWGVHTNSPSDWTSLVGNGETILLQDHFVYSFDSNSLLTTGSAGVNTQYLTVPVIANLLNTSEWTVEIMAQCYGTYIPIIRTYPWGSEGNFVVERGNNVVYLTATDISGSKIFSGTGDATNGYMASYTLRYKDNVLYRDWMVVGESDARHDTLEWTKPALKTTNYSIGQNNKYHFIRLYSRALTASELAANYAIDKARFNLT